MNLFFQTYPQDDTLTSTGTVPVIIIPGLFGSTSNWRRLAKQLGEHHPIIVIDQRNHGRSPHLGSHNYQDMVDDLFEFIEQQGFDKVTLCGHSMGGKVAMAFSLLHPDKVDKLVILDIAPVTYQHSHAPFLEQMIELDLTSLESRSAADKALQSAIPDTSTRLFLLQSLTGRAGSFAWRLNLATLHREMPKIVGFPSAELDGLSNNVDTLVIKGELSDYVKPSDHMKIRVYFPNVEFKNIANAGHWLHVEQPKSVLETLLLFLQKGEKND